MDILDAMKAVAAELIQPRFRALRDDQVFLKGPNDYVTVADREAEAALTERLRAAYPDAVVIGEEATAADPSVMAGIAGHAHAFTVDPVDGTRNFVQGKPDYCVMIGELRHGVPTRGWIWQPETEIAHVAERGQGVERNGVKVAWGPRAAKPAGASPVTRVIGRVTEALAEPVSKTRWCAGIDYADLVDGLRDFVVFKPPKPWDHVPGVLMVRELGGVARLIDGREYAVDLTEPDLVAAATEAAYEAALSVVY